MNLAGQLQRGLILLMYSFCVILLNLPAPARGDQATGRIPVSIYWLWYGQTGGASPADPLVRLMREDPSIEVREWSSLQLPGAGGRTPLMLAIAGQSAPDLFLSWYHILRTDITQGFTYPLNEWIGTDQDGDSQVSLQEARWDGWQQVPQLWRQVSTVDGQIYGLPVSSTSHMSIVFRTDLVRQAGLDPDNPPQTWDEFFYWCQKLTDPGKYVPGSKIQEGQRALAVTTYGWLWLPWMQSVGGGSPVVQVKVSPTTGKAYRFPMEATTFITPDTGEDLRDVTTRWEADLNSEAGKRATAFLHRLRWQRWIRDPETHEPINLTNEQARVGRVTLANGRVVTFTPNDVVTGVVRVFTGQPGESTMEWLGRGEVAMVQEQFDDFSRHSTWVNPDLLGAFPIPAGPGGQPVVQLFRHFAVMGEGVGRRSPEERQAVWKVLTALTSPAAYDETVRRMVLNGQARFVNPYDLERLGFGDYVREVPASLTKLHTGLRDGTVLGRTEPYMGFWVTMDMALNNNMLSLLFASSGEHFDYNTALDELNYDANHRTMFDTPPEALAKYRPTAWTIFAVVAVILLVFIVMIVKTNLAAHTTGAVKSRAGVYQGWVPWLLLVPAIGLIGLWGYYPLLRGIVMAFQDYHIVGESPWVGLDNFIGIFRNPDFYLSVRQTFKYVFLSLALVFCAPIVLSLFLSEIPKGKLFWRSVFFLPQLTSGLVIVLLWKLIYNPTEVGLLNQVVRLFGGQTQDWLGNPDTAMLCTIVPTVWAGMGISSLIYLAALKGIPDELYEAAALDGAGVIAKLRYITIPQLMPLIIINFVGSFIATFQTMGNIFLLTFGGPGKETMVLSMTIWLEAYTKLHFSVATAMAWILGSALIGFAYLQINVLRKVEFRRVEEV
jgi:multiple sugar transport system permease protein